MRSIFHHFKRAFSYKKLSQTLGCAFKLGLLFITLLLLYQQFHRNFYFSSLNNYGFSNLLLLFVQIKYLIVCAIHLDNNLITNITLLIFYYITPWFKMILSHKNLKCFTRKLLYERSSAVTPLPSIYLRLQN